jgi:hypothetical protein
MNNLTSDECISSANSALSTLEGYSITKEDIERCLKDWYDRGNNYCLGMGGVKHAYRRMPKKPWATKEWVAMRDIKLYKFMMNKFSNVFWERVWSCGYSLIPRSPKFKCFHDVDETLRSEKFYKMCLHEIECLEFGI